MTKPVQSNSIVDRSKWDKIIKPFKNGESDTSLFKRARVKMYERGHSYSAKKFQELSKRT